MCYNDASDGSELCSIAPVANLPPFSSGFKLIILDEADNMTQTAQNALRRVIEKYTRNVRFCMICNYASKIIPALQSRCTRFRFAPLKLEQIKSRLDFILEKEQTNVTPDGIEAVLKMSQGDMRRALNILQVRDSEDPGVMDDVNTMFLVLPCGIRRYNRHQRISLYWQPAAGRYPTDHRMDDGRRDQFGLQQYVSRWARRRTTY